MNEPANFATTQSQCDCDGDNECAVCSCPPFLPTGSSLTEKTIDLCATHAGGVRHLRLHNMYGFHETVATVSALTSVRPNLRPFVLSRSTFAGSGRMCAHWLGDNFSLWLDLRRSISGMLDMGLFGIPFVGADIW